MILPRPDDWDEPVQIPPLVPVGRILVPFDGSHTAERALAWARLVGERGPAEVIVVVAYEPPLTTKGRGAAYVEAVRDQLASEAMSLASESVTLLQGESVSARAIVVKGDPARAILDVADDEGVGMIVIGRQGLTAELGGITGALGRFREMLSGGVAEKIARYAQVPVLLVS